MTGLDGADTICHSDLFGVSAPTETDRYARRKVLYSQATKLHRVGGSYSSTYHGSKVRQACHSLPRFSFT